MKNNVHQAILNITEPKFVAIIEKLPIYAFEKLYETVSVGQCLISLSLHYDYEEIRFYDKCGNNFSTIRFTYFGNAHYFVYRNGTCPATREQLFDSLSSESEDFIEWILWNQILC